MEVLFKLLCLQDWSNPRSRHPIVTLDRREDSKRWAVLADPLDLTEVRLTKSLELAKRVEYDGDEQHSLKLFSTTSLKP